MQDKSPKETRGSIRRTAIALALIAVAFYLGFILLMYSRAQ